MQSENLLLRSHDADELAHYAKDGCGTFDVEYRFPFTAPGYGELEGVAHRSNFDLSQHAQHAGAKLEYFDQERNERYLPHVIEPSAGLSRGVLAVLCEAYTEDPDRPSGVYMKFHPRVAPIKAGIFPLVNKDGLPEIASAIHRELRGKYRLEYDPKQSIGKRYARMDEAGTPFCFTVDAGTLETGNVTVRHRDTLAQETVNKDQIGKFLEDQLDENLLGRLQLLPPSRVALIHFSRTTAARDSLCHGSRGDLDGSPRRPIAHRPKCVHRHASSRGRRSPR